MKGLKTSNKKTDTDVLMRFVFSPENNFNYYGNVLEFNQRIAD